MAALLLPPSTSSIMAKNRGLNIKIARILLANSKSLSFSALIFGKAQERLDWELKFKRWGHRQCVL